MELKRGSGILLHPTSLPGEFGIGDLGDEAFKFIEFLSNAGQGYWQILPLGPTGYGDSPYQCFSAFAGNTLLISPQKLVDDGLLTGEQLDQPDFNDDRVDYGGVYDWKNRILPMAFESFRSRDDLRTEFDEFCSDSEFWLGDYALYRAIKSSQGQRPWYEWPTELKFREVEALRVAEDELGSEIEAEKFYQFLFYKQWSAVRAFANEKGIALIGDIPIFVSRDSADIWRYQDQFKLNDDGSPAVVAGVPPDFFSKTGQLWGNPIYDWDVMLANGFSWWAERVKASLKQVDIVRIDHFRGFAAAWEVPGADKTAENGEWVNVPGKELFEKLRDELGDLPFLVEDLGHITPDVEELRDQFGLAGMRILQFAFGGDAMNKDLPHNYIQNCVVFTGTHDNDTTVAWFESQGKREATHVKEYLASDGSEIHWDLIRAAWASVAGLAVAPMQDVLGIGREGRMNLPASEGGNWQWRLLPNAINEETTARLRGLTGLYGRLSA